MVASVQSGVSINTVTPLPVRPPAVAFTPVSRVVSTPVDQLQTSLPSGRVPAQPLKLFSDFDPIAAGKRNTTAQVSKAHRPASLKAALEPTFQIVDAVDPKIGRALRQLSESDFEMAADGMHDLFAKHDIYAAWVAVAREKGTARLHFSDMILDDRFWKLRDAEKASVLIHEMVHAGDTPIVSHFEKLFGTIANKVKGVEWGDPVEDRAYLHQATINQKLGLGEGDEIYWTVRTYLEDRGLWPVPNRTK